MYTYRSVGSKLKYQKSWQDKKWWYWVYCLTFSSRFDLAHRFAWNHIWWYSQSEMVYQHILSKIVITRRTCSLEIKHRDLNRPAISHQAIDFFFVRKECSYYEEIPMTHSLTKTWPQDHKGFLDLSLNCTLL